MPKQTELIVLSLLLALLLFGCTSSAPIPSASSTPTPTITPTLIPTASTPAPSTATIPSATPTAQPTAPSETVQPQLLKSLPLDLASIDWKKVNAHRNLYESGLPISDYGHLDAAGTANERRNPQPTFFAPLGTPVLAPVDGVVAEVKVLYSGDWTIMYGTQTGHNDATWETEHVIDVLVKPGDVVKAGQQVASVSDYVCTYSKKQYGNDEYCGTGIGLTELGYLVGGNPPQHFCPFGELTDPVALPWIEAALAGARQEINQLAGKDLFKTSKWSAPNCIVTDPVSG